MLKITAVFNLREKIYVIFLKVTLTVCWVSVLTFLGPAISLKGDLHLALPPLKDGKYNMRRASGSKPVKCVCYLYFS